MLIIVFILIFLFLLNFLSYWILLLKQIGLTPQFRQWYKKIFPVIWNTCVILIPIINSNFLQPFFNENISYFDQNWLWFILIGIILIIFGFKIHSIATRLLKTAVKESKRLKLIKKGVYEIVRHPQYLSWFLIYLGITFIFNSFIGIIFSPILFVLTELLCILEEKYLLVSEFEENYEQYKKKTPYRLISPPYNYVFIIMGIILVYIGFMNFINL